MKRRWAAMYQLTRLATRSRWRDNYRIWIKGRRAWNFDILEQIFVSISGNRRRLNGRSARVIAMYVLVDDVNIAVRSHRRDCQHERPVGIDSIIEEAVCLRSHNVRRILALIGHRRVVVSLKGGILVLVREWIEQEIRTSPACGVRFVVVRHFLRVEELSHVVGVVARRLKPQRQVIVVEALRDEFRVPACFECQPCLYDQSRHEVPTMRRVDVCNICIMRRFASPQSHTRRAAQRIGAEMIDERSPLLSNMLSSMRHISQRIHVKVLIIGEDHDNIGLLLAS